MLQHLTLRLPSQQRTTFSLLMAACPAGLTLQMKVDMSRRETLHVTFNITFPALPCEALLMDAGDVSGKWQTESRIQVAR